MASKFVSRENVIVILGVVMVVCLPLTILTGAVALIWNGQTTGTMATTTADVFGSAFSVAFFAAFGLRMAEERSRDS
jgi:uncharacterized membrane protein YdjX (TVP38/TMEM64 family)